MTLHRPPHYAEQQERSRKLKEERELEARKPLELQERQVRALERIADALEWIDEHISSALGNANVKALIEASLSMAEPVGAARQAPKERGDP